MTGRTVKSRPQLNASSLRVFQVLSALARSDQPLGVLELARQLGIPASTAHRALATLQARDFVAQEPRAARYYVGSATRLVTAAFFSKFPIRNESMTCLRSLALLTGNTAALWVKIDSNMIRIAQIEAESEIVHRRAIGQCIPLDQCAAGLAIIAANTDDRRPRVGPQMKEFGRSLRATGFLSLESSDFIAHAAPIQIAQRRTFASITIEGGHHSRSSFGSHRKEARKLIQAFAQDLVHTPGAINDPFAHLGE
jgi:DNA-binding IclR family transcriptional regulator